MIPLISTRNHRDKRLPHDEGAKVVKCLKRDMDMARDLLLQIEAGKTVFQILDPASADALGIEPDAPMTEEEADKLALHLDLLADAGFIDVRRLSGGYWQISSLNWAGHDFIDSVRDPKIWQATKAAATKAGGFSVDLLKALAKGPFENAAREVHRCRNRPVGLPNTLGAPK